MNSVQNEELSQATKELIEFGVKAFFKALDIVFYVVIAASFTGFMLYKIVTQ